jgi:FMN-dependent NADH-azoreductase
MKKVIIFTSHAAGGQTSVTDALTHSLASEYSVVISAPFTDILTPLDPIHKKNVDNLYNWFLLKKWNWFVNNVF